MPNTEPELEPITPVRIPEPEPDPDIDLPPDYDRLELIEFRLDNIEGGLTALLGVVNGIAVQISGIAHEIAQFKAAVGPALQAVSSGGIVSALLGRKR